MYNGEQVNNFQLRYDAPTCDPYFLKSGNTPIDSSNRFEIKISFSGQGQSSQVNGTFLSTTTVGGTYDIYYVSGSVCGPYDKQGTWSASKQ
jgi:hypothetical protein